MMKNQYNSKENMHGSARTDAITEKQQDINHGKREIYANAIWGNLFHNSVVAYFDLKRKSISYDPDNLSQTERVMLEIYGEHILTFQYISNISKRYEAENADIVRNAMCQLEISNFIFSGIINDHIRDNEKFTQKVSIENANYKVRLRFMVINQKHYHIRAIIDYTES